jgi:hypothetical protein
MGQGSCNHTFCSVIEIIIIASFEANGKKKKKRQVVALNWNKYVKSIRLKFFIKMVHRGLYEVLKSVLSDCYELLI